MALETNLFSAAIRPVKDWTSLIFFGGSMSNIAWILSGFASIPLYKTMNPRNFPEETPLRKLRMHICLDSASFDVV